MPVSYHLNIIPSHLYDAISNYPVLLWKLFEVTTESKDSSVYSLRSAFGLPLRGFNHGTELSKVTAERKNGGIFRSLIWPEFRS